LKNLLIFITISFAAIKSSAQNNVMLVVEPNHSTIGFAIPIAGGTTRVTGKFMDFDIEVNYNKEDFTKSSISANIKTTSIIT